MRKVYVLPNLFTTASLFCGLLAILNVFNVADSPMEEPHLYVKSCWLILGAAVLDLLDGLVARLTHTESLFGAQYDSLADVIAFGVAPTILIYTRMVTMENRHMAELIATTFPICGALRLARFNVQKTKLEKNSFTGLPIPAAAGAVVSAFLFFQREDPEWNRPFVMIILSVLMVTVSILMVSQVSYPSFKQIKLEHRQPFDILPIIVFGAALMWFFKNHIERMVFAGFMLYLMFGIVNAGLNWARGPRKRPVHAPAHAPAHAAAEETAGPDSAPRE